MSPGRPGDRGSAAYDERGEIEDPTVHTSRRLDMPQPTDPMPHIEGQPSVEHHKLGTLPKMGPEDRAVYGLEDPKPDQP